MVGHLAVEAEAAEPAIGQVQVDLLAQPPLRADAKAVADDQHPDHQLRVDRGPTLLAVEWRQLPAAARRGQRTGRSSAAGALGHMIFERKLVKQGVLPDAAFPHHRLHPRPNDQSKSATPNPRNPYFFNAIAPKQTSAVALP